MLEFYISKDILGTSKSLVHSSDGTFKWEDSPKSDYAVGDASALISIAEIAKLLDINVNLEIGSQKQKNAFAELGVSERQIMWSSALPPQTFYNRLRYISEEVKKIICAYGNTEYGQTYKECKEFLRSLSRASVNVEKIQHYIENCKSGPSVVSSLKSFLPPKGENYAPQAIYSQTSTSTGRLVVKSGPSILTLPAKNRDILKSSVGGKIFQVDFVSLEPRVMRYVNNHPAPDDIYSDIKNKLFNSEIERKIVKLATLSALYGSSYRSISEITGNKEASKNVVRRVRQYFEVDRMERGLMRILHEEKQIANYYGRPLKIEDPRPNILISHYVQSTAVDTALLGFSKLMKDLTLLKIVPIYVIHDAVVVDVPMNKIEEFYEICNNGIQLPLGQFKFDVTQLSADGE
tara:strand:+ start:155 stop:1369 length:1215 start_codon:yes stop_codon:yes gene_type:complete